MWSDKKEQIHCSTLNHLVIHWSPLRSLEITWNRHAPKSTAQHPTLAILKIAGYWRLSRWLTGFPGWIITTQRFRFHGLVVHLFIFWGYYIISLSLWLLYLSYIGTLDASPWNTSWSTTVWGQVGTSWRPWFPDIPCVEANLQRQLLHAIHTSVENCGATGIRFPPAPYKGEI